MELDQESVNERLQPLLARILPLYEKGMLEKNDENFWAARAALTFNDEARIDRGIFSIYIFNRYLEEKVNHFPGCRVANAYLEGQNVNNGEFRQCVRATKPKHSDV